MAGCFLSKDMTEIIADHFLSGLQCVWQFGIMDDEFLAAVWVVLDLDENPFSPEEPQEDPAK